MDPGTLLVAEQAISTTVEGLALASIGIAQKTLPLSATLTRISSPGFLPRSSHTLSVVNDHAYIFGGVDEKGELAGNEVHIVTLPVKSKVAGEPNYKCVPALGTEDGDGSVPGGRAGHTTCVVGERIFVFGGKGNDGQALEEKGRVWVFDTQSLEWTYLNPSGDSCPGPRFNHCCVGSKQPLPQGSEGKLHALSSQIQESVSKSLPKLISKPSPPVELHGTLFISSGISSDASDPLDDIWAYNIASNTWSQLPSSPTKYLSPPSLAIVTNHLYLIIGTDEVASEIHQLPIGKYVLDQKRNEEANSAVSWQAIPFPTNPLVPGPRPRKGAGLLPITTGNGRLYLLYFFGEKAIPGRSTKDGEARTFWSDIFSYQTHASSPSPASIKDSTRSTLGVGTGEGTWAEVKVIANEEGAGKTAGEGKSHPGPRGWFGYDAIGGADVVMWGGVNGKEDTEGDGWIISVK